MSSAKFTLTAELLPHLDAPLPISPQSASFTRSPNPFGAIARPSGTKSQPPADLNSHPRSPIIFREQFDSSFVSDICRPESLIISDCTMDEDDDYSSIPHYISSIWNYLTPDDLPESKNKRVPTPASTLACQYVYNSHPGPTTGFSHFLWRSVTSAPKARVPTDTYAANYYPPPYYSSNYVAPTCLCVQCRGFPLPNSFPVSPSETPLASPLPTTPADETYPYSLDVIA
ncbi:MAG: hypothetical protein NXY57DRAFT_1043645 [Lentinula lateritia]|uniref:Uncharacterized protein n=1 Tax=Lentinula lateritia TaxID=40482 RepID=A0ABQ8VBR3_9AGAR|nr:MAG: hypothetical protein NXY57DRAFT_1043645 [Lentinula lateritia]KAJ4486428.1 hypothetical protein C8R41DRAFT_838297 [Lentinula lateritia]